MSETPDLQPELDAQWCLRVALPLLHKAYQDGAESKFGLNRKKWSALSRVGLAVLGSFSWPQEFEEKATLYMEQKLFPWEEASDTRTAIGLVADSPDTRIIVLRGTLGLYEWYHDLLFRQTTIDTERDIRVHKGFWEMTESVRSQVEPWLEEGDKPVLWIGHSLGAALAQLFAFSSDSSQSHLFTFGSPRVGNKAFAEALNQAIPTFFRLEYEWDLIPNLPLESIPGTNIKYRHAGTRVLLKAAPGSNQKQTEKVRKLVLSHMPVVYQEAMRHRTLT